MCLLIDEAAPLPGSLSLEVTAFVITEQGRLDLRPCLDYL